MIFVAILERPVIEMILNRLRLDPRLPPKDRPGEPMPHFAGQDAPVVGHTLPQVALRGRTCGELLADSARRSVRGAKSKHFESPLARQGRCRAQSPVLLGRDSGV